MQKNVQWQPSVLKLADAIANFKIMMSSALTMEYAERTAVNKTSLDVSDVPRLC